MTPRTDTRARILAIAEGHLMRRGYHAFSFADIAQELGIKPAAIHYHFATKPELVCAVIQAYARRFDRWVAAVEGLSAADRLTGYFEVGRLLVSDGRVCPLSMLTAEQDAIPADVVEEVRGLHARILAFYVDSLAQARTLGAASFGGSPEDEGGMVACTLVGAQLLARLHGPDAYVRVMRQQGRALGLPEQWSAFPTSAWSAR